MFVHPFPYVSLRLPTASFKELLRATSTIKMIKTPLKIFQVCVRKTKLAIYSFRWSSKHTVFLFLTIFGVDSTVFKIISSSLSFSLQWQSQSEGRNTESTVWGSKFIITLSNYYWPAKSTSAIPTKNYPK